MSNIFISYRRDDSRWQARLIYDALTKVLSPDRVFMDVDSIKPGEDFAEILEGCVQRCDILLALIGAGWASATDPKTGKRRIDNPDDFVRVELREALKRNIPVVPVLLDNASLPDAGELPDDLKKLVRRQALVVDFRTFDADVAMLIKRLNLGSGLAPVPTENERKAPEPEPAAGGAWPLMGSPAQGESPHVGKSFPVYKYVALAAVVAVLGGGLLILHPWKQPAVPPEAPPLHNPAREEASRSVPSPEIKNPDYSTQRGVLVDAVAHAPNVKSVQNAKAPDNMASNAAKAPNEVLPVAEAPFRQVVFDHPRYQANGAPIDACLYPAKQCGKPAADRFCEIQNSGKASAFTEEQADQPTFILGSSGFCTKDKFDRCDTFKQISCVSAVK